MRRTALRHPTLKKSTRDFFSTLLVLTFAAGSFWLFSCGGGGDGATGGGLIVHSVNPPRTGITGGGTVEIVGDRFAAGATVRFGLTSSPSVSVIDSTLILAQVPPGSAGKVDLEVKNPSGAVYRILDGFEYLLIGTPMVNGSFSDWNAGYELAASSAIATNTLDTLSAAFDSTNLYFAVVENVPAGYGVILWLDVDAGSGAGYANLAGSLNDVTGTLDGLMSVVKATLGTAGIRVDAAIGSIDHAAVADTFADRAGFRAFGTDGLPGSATDFAPGRSTVTPGTAGLEIAVPLAAAFPSGMPVSGATVALFVTATPSTGDFPSLPGFTLPDQLAYGTNTRTITSVASMRVFPQGQY